jgi:hypothetical protein
VPPDTIVDDAFEPVADAPIEPFGPQDHAGESLDDLAALSPYHHPGDHETPVAYDHATEHDTVGLDDH